MYLNYWLVLHNSDVKGIDHHDDKTIVIVFAYKCPYVHSFVRLKILWFTKEVFFIFQVFQNLPLKLIRIFSYIPISEVAPKFSRKFHKIIIKIFQEFVVNAPKTVLSKNFLNLFEISWIVKMWLICSAFRRSKRMLCFRGRRVLASVMPRVVAGPSFA